MLDARGEFDVAVIGAGPAGLAAATVCAQAGLSTVLLDEQASPGGQIYRSVTATPVKENSVFGADYWSGARLVRNFLASAARHVPNAMVWNLTREREIAVSIGGASHILRARRVILATGALERPFPVPGWTLPGVMTVGAGQILLKSAALVPSGRTALAGCGPLLWLLAWQYLNAGLCVDAILDTSARLTGAVRHMPAFLLSPYLGKGLRLLAAVRRRVRVIADVVALRAEGGTRIETVVYRAGNGLEQRLPVDTLFLHQGVVPHCNLAMAAGIEHRWDEAQLCWRPVIDASGNTAIPGIAIAGDAAGIAGAEAAQARGEIAGMDAVSAMRPERARDVGRPEAQMRAALSRAMRGRSFLDVYYRPAEQFRIPAADTIVCRCEEITAGEVLRTIALGCTGPNQMKAFLRCGMGPCQGRECALTVTELIAKARGVAPQAVGSYRIRPPVKPIALSELAQLPKDESALRSVARS